MSETNAPALEMPVASARKNWGVRMNFSSSKDESLLSLWESVRRQVLAGRANAGRCRFVGNNLRTYAELLRSEMDQRELKYTPINWSE
ncbi:hypothetical protein [Bradyrhizobium murdochi]|uniref:hypothetical protein n=1 Tax=Bradyrhizobium murdochi TaxID=1038859 RepID=UPI0012EB8214|nr:hypothetical protein [Bradyrhizobium murdochi]